MILTPNIGFKSVRGKSKQEPQPIYEAETTAYMTEVGIPDDSSASIYGVTNNTVWVAVNDFVLELKSIGWSKLFYIYPKIGGTGYSQAINLISATDTGSFSGTWVHNETGAVSNGSNTYFNTGFNPLSNSISSNDIGGTIKTISINPAGGASAASIFGMYANISNDQRFQLYLVISGSDSRGYLGGNMLVGNSGTTGIFTIQRDSDISYLIQNSTELDSVNESGKTMPNYNVYEAASSRPDLTAGNHISATITTSVYHKYLNASEISDLHTAIDNLDSTLNRI